MEKNDATGNSNPQFIIHQAMTVFVLYPGYSKEVAILIYGALKSNASINRWGSVMIACKKSECFHPLSIQSFQSLCRVLLGEAPAESTVKKSLEAITKAFQTENSKRNNEKDAEWRTYTRNLANAIRVACGFPIVEIR